MSELGQESKQHNERRVFGLDALRAAAIMGVVLAHYFVLLYPHFGDYLGFFGHLGFYGVELFFVLSGFLIGQILLRTGLEIGQPRNLLLFYVRRWFRTLPLFLLFFAVNLLIEFRLRHHSLSTGEIAAARAFRSNLLCQSNHVLWRILEFGDRRMVLSAFSRGAGDWRVPVPKV